MIHSSKMSKFAAARKESQKTLGDVHMKSDDEVMSPIFRNSKGLSNALRSKYLDRLSSGDGVLRSFSLKKQKTEEVVHEGWGYIRNTDDVFNKFWC